MPDEIQQRIDFAKGQQARLHLEGERLTAELAVLQRTLQEQVRTPVADTAAINKMKTEVQRLAEQLQLQNRNLADLERQRSEYAVQSAEIEVPQHQLEELAKELAKVEDENQNTRAAITRLSHESATRPVLKVEGTPRTDLLTQRRPVYLVLTENRVAPLRPPFYKRTQKVVEAGPGQFEAIEVAIRQEPGEPLDKALAAGSALMEVLNPFDSDDCYLVFLVDADSFAAFRAVREFSRNRGLRFGWEPFTETASIRLTASGQVVGEEVRGPR